MTDRNEFLRTAYEDMIEKPDVMPIDQVSEIASERKYHQAIFYMGPKYTHDQIRRVEALIMQIAEANREPLILNCTDVPGLDKDCCDHCHSNPDDEEDGLILTELGDQHYLVCCKAAAHIDANLRRFA